MLRGQGGGRMAERAKYIAWIVIAIILAAAIVAAVYIYAAYQPRPFWEIE